MSVKTVIARGKMPRVLYSRNSSKSSRGHSGKSSKRASPAGFPHLGRVHTARARGTGPEALLGRGAVQRPAASGAAGPGGARAAAA
jgi:hypothetical protein